MQGRSTKARGVTGRQPTARESGKSRRDRAESERFLLARQVRGARAVLGWSQTELADRIGLTQPAIHKIEQGRGDLKHSTFVALERLFMAEGVTFETTQSGFKIVVKRV